MRTFLTFITGPWTGNVIHLSVALNKNSLIHGVQNPVLLVLPPLSPRRVRHEAGQTHLLLHLSFFIILLPFLLVIVIQRLLG